MATVNPPIGGADVYFKVWDVDDPFDQIHGPLGADDVPNVDLIDNNQAGADNRPVPEGPWTHTATTEADGTATWTFTVSMQPGNNYRAAASALSDVFRPDPQVTQATADLLGVKTDSQGNFVANGGFSGYKVPVVWSEMLTVWRKLHVEVDSMAAEATTVVGRSPDWDTVFVAAVTSDTVAQTTTFTVRGQTKAPISFELASSEVNHYEGGTLTVPGQVAPFDVIASRKVWDANLSTYVGEVVVGAVLTALEQQNAIDSTSILRDDDPVPPQLPFFIPIANDPFIPGVYLPAYIVIEEVPPAYNPRTIVPFDVNLTDFELQTGVGYDNSQDISSTEVYWTALLVSGFQPKESADYDADLWIGPNVGGFSDNPDHDPTIDYGITVEDGDNASVVYVEVLRDVGAVTDRDISHITAHEIGHSCGPNTPEAEDHAEGMLMQPSPTIFDNAFSAQTLLRFRRYSKW